MNTILYINGRFLTKPTTGTERFAREIVWALDAFLSENNSDVQIELLAPQGTPAPNDLQKIRFRTCGKHQGHIWEQWDLYQASRKGRLLSMINCGPVLHGHQWVVVHDALVYLMAKGFSLSYILFHRIMGYILAKRAKLVTVSAFSQKELASVFGVSPQEIKIVPNGYEHIIRNSADLTILDKLAIRNKPFFLFVGAPVPRKNLKQAIKAFSSINNKDALFVIVGSANANVFRQEKGVIPHNVLMAGRLSDEEIVALYQNATALVFPSLYEGFGIPPLEAMVHGCPVVASDIPAVKEVCADAALYFDPNNMNDISMCMQKILSDQELRANMIEKGKQRFHNFTWKESARTLAALLDLS